MDANQFFAEVAKEIRREEEDTKIPESWRTLADFADPVPEDEDPNVIVKGAFLERGGTEFFIATAGVGKSIYSIQYALSAAAGVPFAGHEFYGSYKVWIVQGEDSDRRIARDRNDILNYLVTINPSVDWRKAASNVTFVEMAGLNGASFLAALHGHLSRAKRIGILPDILIINPLNSFIGCDVSNAGDVLGFLRGGSIGQDKSIGMDAILKEFNIGCIVFHHTPKPPRSDKELEQWESTPYPEYLAAGSSDLTNFGRSFITMFKTREKGIFRLRAGKNGNELGWHDNDMFLAYSGTGEHYWRELSEDEYQRVRGKSADEIEREKYELMARSCSATAQTLTDFRKNAKSYIHGRNRDALISAFLDFRHKDFGLVIAETKIGKYTLRAIGTAFGANDLLTKLRAKNEFSMDKIMTTSTTSTTSTNSSTTTSTTSTP